MVTIFPIKVVKLQAFRKGRFIPLHRSGTWQTSLFPEHEWVTFQCGMMEASTAEQSSHPTTKRNTALQHKDL